MECEICNELYAVRLVCPCLILLLLLQVISTLTSSPPPFIATLIIILTFYSPHLQHRRHYPLYHNHHHLIIINETINSMLLTLLPLRVRREEARFSSAPMATGKTHNWPSVKIILSDYSASHSSISTSGTLVH
jgi:hypothetical protein